MKFVAASASQLVGATIALAQVCGSWTQVIDGPSAAFGHQAVFDTARRHVLVFDGAAGSAARETWAWDGSMWLLLSSTGPVSRTDHAMCYDSDRMVTVLHGGDGPGLSIEEDTWEWLGTSWAFRTSGIPIERRFHAMAYDPKRKVSVLYGGVNDFQGYMGDTWEWNGNVWKERFPAHSPGPLATHHMVYDERAERVLLVVSGGSYVDMWTYDGTDWTFLGSEFEVSTISPIVYDSWRGLVLIFPGTKSNKDLWEWDGQTWKFVAQPTGAPLPKWRYSHAMAFDRDRGVVVLYGGQDEDETFSDTWEYRPCFPDCERDCDLDVFDYLCFLDRFFSASAMPYCDFERDGDLDIFDFLEFQGQFAQGCE